MTGATFKTNPIALEDLLRQCHKGELQLPDFQRSWVWDEERIKSLIASVSRGFPIGALMTLERGGEVEFKPRTVEGAPPEAKKVQAQSLLLDGQQRMTSLYQVTIRNKVVETVTPKHKKVRRWFYIDIRAALEDDAAREEAIVAIPEDRMVRSAFNRDVDLDLSSREAEFEHFMYPVSGIFDWDNWQKEFIEHAMKVGDFSEKWKVIKAFKEQVIDQFTKYHVPVIALGACAVEVLCWAIGARPPERWDFGPSVDIWPARLWDGNPRPEGRNGRDSRFIRGRWALRAPEQVRWQASTCLSTWPASPSA